MEVVCCAGIDIEVAGDPASAFWFYSGPVLVSVLVLILETPVPTFELRLNDIYDNV